MLWGVFFLNHWHDSSAASLGKRTIVKFCHFPESTLVTFWIWNRPSGKTCGGNISAPKTRARWGERAWVNEAESKRGEGKRRVRKAKQWKGGWSRESASEDVPGHIYALFSPQWRLSLVGPAAEPLVSERKWGEHRRSALHFSLLYLWDSSWKSNRHKMENKRAAARTEAPSLTSSALWTTCQHRHWSDCFLSHLCTKPPWKGRLTCPYPFIWVQMARGIHCVRESSLNSLVWPVISQPKVGRFGKLRVCHKKSPADLPRVKKPLWRAFQGFYVNRVKGEVWGLSVAEPMDWHQKGI